MILTAATGLFLAVAVAFLAGATGQTLSPEVRSRLHRWLADPVAEAGGAWPVVARDVTCDLFRPWRLWPVFGALLGNFLITVISAAPSARRIVDQAALDSFYTLTLAQRAVLLLLSALLIFVLFGLVLAKTRFLLGRFGGAGEGRLLGLIILDGALTCAIFALGLSLAPQVYYAYYQMIFPGLPLQWVIQPLLGPGGIWALFSLAPGLGLGQLLAGLTLRACLLTTAWLLIFALAARICFGLPVGASVARFPVVMGAIAAVLY